MVCIIRFYCLPQFEIIWGLHVPQRWKTPAIELATCWVLLQTNSSYARNLLGTCECSCATKEQMDMSAQASNLKFELNFQELRAFGDMFATCMTEASCMAVVLSGYVQWPYLDALLTNFVLWHRRPDFRFDVPLNIDKNIRSCHKCWIWCPVLPTLLRQKTSRNHPGP